MATSAKIRGRQKILFIHRTEARRLLGGIAERTFASLEADGVLIPAKRGRGRRPSEYDPFSIVPAYIQHIKSATVGADREARAQRDRAQAALHELRLKERSKDLLPRDQVVRDGRAFVLAARAKLLALPRRMAQAGLVPADRQTVMADLLHEALEEMARWQTHLDLLTAARTDA